MIDSHSFREFEHSGWQGIPRQYHQAFGELTIQSIEPLLDAAGVKAGTKVIDIASGPGYVAAAAARRGATVIGVDFSAAMVAEARAAKSRDRVSRRRRRAIAVRRCFIRRGGDEFRHPSFGAAGSGARGSLPCLVCRRSVCFTVWAKPDEAMGFGIVLASIAEHGDPNVPLPEGPPFFRFSEPDECIRSLHAAGFASPKVVKVPQTWRLPAVDSLFAVHEREHGANGWLAARPNNRGVGENSRGHAR